MIIDLQFALHFSPKFGLFSPPTSALGFAGTLLLRSEAELAHVRAAGPLGVLREVGLPVN